MHGEGVFGTIQLIDKFVVTCMKKEIAEMFYAKQYQALTIYHAPLFANQQNLIHGFSSRFGGLSKMPYTGLNLGLTSGDDMETVKKNRILYANALGISPEQVVVGFQVHGTQIARVTTEDCGKGFLDAVSALPDTDGLVSAERGVALMTLYADCVPVLFYDAYQQVIAVCHCGWRGTVNRMAAKTAGVMMHEYGCKAEHILAAIGPSISLSHYEVDETVLAQFEQAFSFADQLIVPTDAHHGKLDLWKANSLQLQEIGVLPQHIDVSELCTYQHAKQFYSHRAEHGVTGRNAAMLMLRE